MIDVRLTATNPEDSSLVPVPCNARGELLTVAPKIEVIPNDVEVQGDLTVTGLINGSDGVGEQGPPGADGKDGKDGKDGAPGKDGEDGKDGQPGLGQLPPNPLEGALLGWQDGELAWIGGAVPLPAGTYGPFIYDANAGTLTVEQDVSALINGQQLFMSDNQGNVATETVSTKPISNVSDLVNRAIGKWDAPYNQLPSEWDDITDGLSYIINDASQFICDTSLLGETVVTVSQNPSGFRGEYRGSNDGNTYTTVSEGEQVVSFDGSFPYRYFTVAVIRREVGKGGCSLVISTTLKSSGTKLLFPDASSFNYFNVGDVVQDPDVKITEIDVENNSMAVNVGSWCGSDGYGDCNFVRAQLESTSTENLSSKASSSNTTISKSLSGAGSVLTSGQNGIVLRSNNGEWVNGYFVTSPEQLIAARKALASPEFRAEMRRKRD